MPKVLFKLRPESQAAFVSCMFSLISAMLLCVIYWPVLLFYIRGLSTDPESDRIAVFCGLSIALMLLYSIVTGLFANRTLTLPALFALPVSLLLISDIIGLRNTLLFFNFEDVLHVYRQQHPFFRGWWLFLGLTGLIMLSSAFSYIKISFHRARNLVYGLLTGLLATLFWIAFSLLRLSFSELPDYRLAIDGFSGRDLTYSILYYIAGLFFFLSVLVILFAVRKTLVGAEYINEPFRVTPAQNDAGAVEKAVPEQTVTVYADSYAADYQTPQSAVPAANPYQTDMEIADTQPDTAELVESINALDSVEPLVNENEPAQPETAAVSLEMPSEDAPPKAAPKKRRKKKETSASTTNISDTETTEVVQ